MVNAAEENWQILASLFPSGWQEQASRSGAIERRRGITSPETLLRLFLLHLGRGYSLHETAVRAGQAGPASISGVGLLKRLQRSEDWLHWLYTRLLAENGVDLPAAAGDTRLRIVDGTFIKEPGKSGSEWRILYSLQLPDLRCDFFDLIAAVDPGAGDGLIRLPIARRDLILAAAGCCSVPGIESVTSRGGDVVVRIGPHYLPLAAEDGGSFDLLARLGELSVPGRVRQWPVLVAGTAVQGRVCAIRKSEEAIRMAHDRIERRASRTHTNPLPENRECARYVAVFTTERSAAAETIMEWYRVAWQIEVSFKRFKSLAQLGHLPKNDPRSARAWLYGKLFVALLTQKLVRIGRELSPWGHLVRH